MRLPAWIWRRCSSQAPRVDVRGGILAPTNTPCAGRPSSGRTLWMVHASPAAPQTDATAADHARSRFTDIIEG